MMAFALLQTFCKNLCVRIFLLLIVLSYQYRANAQGDYNIWYFGKGAGLNFNASPPVTLTNSWMESLESSTGICDSNGKLVLYTNGDTIYNFDHKMIEGGSQLETYSNVQGVVAVKHPTEANKYYIFTSPCRTAPCKIKNDSFIRYTIVDMSLNGGQGKVVVSNEALIPGSHENLAVTRHANKSDYWIVGVTDEGPGKGYIHITRTVNGVINPSLRIIKEFDNHTGVLPHIKFSPNGKMFFGPRIKENGVEYDILYPFNSLTGELGTPLKLPLTTDQTIFRLSTYEFSCDSRYLYIPDYKTVINSGGKIRHRISQYDISSWNAVSIVSSRTTIYEGTPGWGTILILGMQLASDGKVYVFYSHRTSLGVINNPRYKGLASQYNDLQVDLKGRTTLLGGPYYPTFLYDKKVVDLGNDTTICKGDSLILNVGDNPPGTKVIWSNGSQSKELIVKEQGTYWVKLEIDGAEYYDTINVSFKNKFKVYLGTDTAFCGKFSHLLDAGQGANSYKWNTGETTVTKLVSEEGIYSVTVKDRDNCPAGDTILIDQIKAPKIKISFDTVNCEYTTLSLSQKDSGVTYQWDNGDTSKSIRVYEKGKRSITLSNIFCSLTVPIEVDRLARPDADLGDNISTCSTYFHTLTVKDSGQYLWSTGETSKNIVTNGEGIYWVQVSRNNCTSVDSIEITECNFWYSIPNAFSPNGDGLNDKFGVFGEDIINVDLKVFNRWGEMMYDNNGLNPYWNGSFKGKPCSEGIYMYMVSITRYKDGIQKKENLKGTVTLLR